MNSQERQETDTRTRILDAAERLFVAHGLEATTLRQITAEAKANLAAVNYHFGSKEALIEEVFRRGLSRLNHDCLGALDMLEEAAAAEAVKPSRIVEAFFGAALRMAADQQGGGAQFMRLLSRTYTEPTEFVRRFLEREYAPVVARYRAALFRALPEAPREEIVWRLHFMLGAMSYAVSGADALNLLGESGRYECEPGVLHARLMSFLIGGLRAPLPPQASTANARTGRAKQESAGASPANPSGHQAAA